MWILSQSATFTSLHWSQYFPRIKWICSHLNCDDAVESVVFFHAGEAGGFRCEGQAFLIFLVRLEAPSHLFSGGGQSGGCGHRRMRNNVETNWAFSKRGIAGCLCTVQCCLPRHPSSATSRRGFMLDGECLQISRAEGQGASWGFYSKPLRGAEKKKNATVCSGFLMSTCVCEKTEITYLKFPHNGNLHTLLWKYLTIVCTEIIPTWHYSQSNMQLKWKVFLWFSSAF